MIKKQFTKKKEKNTVSFRDTHYSKQRNHSQNRSMAIHSKSWVAMHFFARAFLYTRRPAINISHK